MLSTAYKIIMPALLAKKPHEVVGALCGTIFFLALFFIGVPVSASFQITPESDGTYWTNMQDFCVDSYPLHVRSFFGDPFTGTPVPANVDVDCDDINPTGSFAIVNVPGANSNLTGFYYVVATSTTADVYFTFYYDGVDVDLLEGFETFTHIVSITPSDYEIVSTSTYFFIGSEFFVAPEDVDEDLFFRIKYFRNQDSQVAVANQDLLWTTIDFVPDDWNVASGYNSFGSTTLTSVEGQYTLKVELRKNTTTNSILSFFGLSSLYDNGLIISSSTQFIAGERTAYDVFVASTTDAITGPNGFFASSTISFDMADEYCSFSLNFSITDCFSLLFGWQNQPMSVAINNLKDGFFSYLPLGYITRSIEILSSSSTTTLPELSYTFPNSAPGFLSSSTIEFSPWEYFYVDGAPVKDELVANDGSNKNIWDIFEPLINIIVYLSLILLVIKDLTGIHANHRNNL